MIRLNPLTLRKIRRFRSIRRGYWSFVALIALYLVSLFGELFVNKRALLLHYEGELFLPTYGKQLTGRQFGLDYDYEVDYRELQKKRFEEEQSGNWLIMPIIPYGPYEMDYADENATGFSPPSLSSGHLCGTDKTERGVLARLLYGFRIAMAFAIGYLSAYLSDCHRSGQSNGFPRWKDGYGGIEVGGNLGKRSFSLHGDHPGLGYAWLVGVGWQVCALLLIMVLFSWTGLTYYVRAAVYKEKSRDTFPPPR